MYIIQNAIKNLGRNKGRNILLGVIIFTLILISAISTTINATTDAIIHDYKTRFGSEVTIFENYDMISKMSNTERMFKPITPAQYFEFGKSELLKSVSYNATISAVAEGLKALDQEENQGSSAIMFGTNGEEQKFINPNVLVKGITNLASNEDFLKGKRTVSQGNGFTKPNECLISEAFAELNSLKVGDTIRLLSMFENEKMPHKLKVVGIYSDTTMVGVQSPFKSAFTNRGNEIIVDIQTASNMEMMATFGMIDATYVLKNPESIEAFEAELRAKGLKEYYNVITDEAGYKKVVGPVEGLSKVSTTFLIAVLALGSVILILLSSLAIRERKYEIGVLRAMGMKKQLVAAGLVTEMMTITLLCLIVAIGFATVGSQPVADILLETQIEALNDANTAISAGPGFSMAVSAAGPIGANSALEPLTNIEIALSVKAVLQIVAISIVLAIVSSLVGIVYITKYEPMRILSERN
jgi:putative ABC transport system permease protein